MRALDFVAINIKTKRNNKSKLWSQLRIEKGSETKEMRLKIKTKKNNKNKLLSEVNIEKDLRQKR